MHKYTLHKSTNICSFAQIMTDTDMIIKDWDCQEHRDAFTKVHAR